MPRHQQVTTCRKGGGPISKFCSCEHCTLAVCDVCGCYEGSLTTDCPGTRVDFDRQTEIYETCLDYTDDRGWHQGNAMELRSPRFTKLPPPAAHAPICVGVPVMTRISGCTCGWECPSHEQDSDTAYSWHVAVAKVLPIEESKGHHTDNLKHVLAQKAVSWAMAERNVEKCSADLTRAQDQAHAYIHPAPEGLGLRGGRPNSADATKALTPTKYPSGPGTNYAQQQAIGIATVQADLAAARKAGHTVIGDMVIVEPDEKTRALLATLESARVNFHVADQRAVRCEDEYKQAARKLLHELEHGPLAGLSLDDTGDREP